MRTVALALSTLNVFAACGEEPPATVAADLPTHPRELGGLCPEPDVPRDFYEREAADARRKAEALIREVRRNPDGQVTVVSQDAHTGETYRDRMTVRELANEHLRKDGAIYRGPGSCEINGLYASRDDLEPVLDEGDTTDPVIVTDPGRTVGVEVFRPTAACRGELERGLTALAAR